MKLLSWRRPRGERSIGDPLRRPRDRHNTPDDPHGLKHRPICRSNYTWLRAALRMQRKGIDINTITNKINNKWGISHNEVRAHLERK